MAKEQKVLNNLEALPYEKLEKYLKENISEIENSFYLKTETATIDINAPLALMQVEYKASLRAYKNVLNFIKEGKKWLL